MKRIKISENLVNYLLVVFSIVLIIVVLFKFVIKKGNPSNFSMDVAAITITSLDRAQIKLIDLVKNKSDTYILVFKLNDCYSCIAKGIEDIQNLHTSGHEYVSIVIHDSLYDIQGFAETFPKVVFYQMTTADQYEHIRSPIFPVVVKLKNDKVVTYKYVTP